MTNAVNYQSQSVSTVDKSDKEIVGSLNNHSYVLNMRQHTANLFARLSDKFGVKIRIASAYTSSDCLSGIQVRYDGASLIFAKRQLSHHGHEAGEVISCPKKLVNDADIRTLISGLILQEADAEPINDSEIIALEN